MIRITEETVQPFETDHIELVRKTAPECTLFLKREEEAFPVTAGEIALYGSGARKTIKGGTGSGDVNVRHFVTMEEGLEKAGFTITSKEWLDAYDQVVSNARVTFVERVKKEAAELGINAVMYGLGKAMPEPEYQIPLNAPGDLAVYVLSRISGEGADRSKEAGDIDLSETEIRDILYCSRKYKKFLLVLNVGGMVNLEPVMEVKNILLLGQLGTPIGDVLADILTGKSNPSGKLAMTWAPIEKYPSTQGFGDMDDTVYSEGIYVGYRYFNTAKVTPTFPFGYGLSYTQFEIGEAVVSADEKEVTVKVSVKNIGAHAGKEVLQLYVSKPSVKLEQPYQDLIAFAKTKELQPAESEEVVLAFQTTDMSSYDEESASYVLEEGTYWLRIGNSSADTKVCAGLHLDETAVVKKCKNICPGAEVPGFKIDAKKEVVTAEVPVYELYAARIKTEEVIYSAEPTELPKTTECTFEDVKNGKVSLDDFVGNLTNEQLAYLSIGMFEDNAGMGSMVGAASKSVAGAAGETCQRLKELGVPTLVMADGPAGIRVCTAYKMVDGKAKGMDNPLSGMLEFMEPEQLQMIAAMTPKPTQEELDAPVHYMYCTAIPIGTALAQSFNVKACEKLGAMVGEEMEQFGIHLWLAPAMNIQRSPLCGRNFEYYSEDPVVSGNIAAAITLGVQSHKGCGTTIKHFALNNQESNRMASNSIASERAIREIYLRNFEICVEKSAPETIMSSYNLVNGEHANNSKDIQTYVLRDEWGYKGTVMTDWYAVGGMMSQAGGRTDKHAAGLASGCIHAGNDITMPGMQSDFDDMLHALDNKDAKYPITRAELQVTAKRVLRTVLKLA
ncbi:MAG: glycoside hydrolase family 3 N-terminal domain-containing protein [Fusicatenibacter sp.]|nr:glycoside hydrolase family 3 N-terminal domain-containing protein [Lachnospiraceae bacterium]MDY2938568.1 glycoside hydrolase family 3 N-terminal domain-containing protein [Fusicatenibacter sp.]